MPTERERITLCSKTSFHCTLKFSRKGRTIKPNSTQSYRSNVAQTTAPEQRPYICIMFSAHVYFTFNFSYVEHVQFDYLEMQTRPVSRLTIKLREFEMTQISSVCFFFFFFFVSCVCLLRVF